MKHGLKNGILIIFDIEVFCMSMPVKDYLLLYFRQRHFNSMPDAERAQFDAYAKNDDFRGDMKSWKRDLVDPQNPKKAEPDALIELDKSGWKALFKYLQNAFRTMDADRSSFKATKEATEFLDTYFGDQYKLFSVAPIKDDIVNNIDILTDKIIEKNYSLFRSNFKDHDEFVAFISDLKQKKYQKDIKVREKLETIISTLSSQMRFGGITDTTLQKQLQGFDLDGLIDGLNPETEVTDQDIRKLKAKYSVILNTLHDESKIYDIFKQYDNGKISKPLDEAIAKTDYTGKITEKDYIPPKRKDQKTVLQDIQGKINETYDDVFKKYMTAHRDHVYIKQSAKNIIGALGSAKLGPIDGIAGIVAKENDIIKTLQNKSPKATEDFKWFVGVMKDFKDTMPKAFEGALRNGRQLHRIVEEMIFVAIDKGKIEEAKTAMEVLSVMRYGLFTSRTMDAINKTDVNIFSDGDLSWNKNEGIQFVTKALDKTIKFGIQGVGYAATAAANGIRRIGTGFNHSGTIQKKSDEWEIKNTNAKNAADQTRLRDNADEKKEIRRINKEKRAIKDYWKTLTIKDQRQAQKKLREGQREEDAARQAHEDCKNKLKPLQRIEEYHTSVKQIDDAKQTIDKLEHELASIPNPATDQLQQLEADRKRQRISELESFVAQNEESLKAEIDSEYGSFGAFMSEYNAMHSVPKGATQSAYDLAVAEEEKTKNILEKKEQENTTLKSSIEQYKGIRDDIELHRASIRSRDEKFAKWDDQHKNQYLELMAYWDFLQTGHTKNLFRLSTKKLQKQMDAKQASGKTKMQSIYEQWRIDNQYVA